MFIALDPKDLKYVGPKAIGTLYYALMVDGVKQDFRVPLNICRVIGSGIGVAFKDPDERALSLLQALAGPAEPASDTPQTETMSDTQRRFAPEFGKVLPLLTQLGARYANQMVKEFLRLGDDAFFLAARDVGNNRDQTKILDGQAEFRRRTDRLKQEVPALLEQGIAILNDPLQQKPRQITDTSPLSALSLVDKDAFEEFLTVSEIISELEPKYKDALHDLNKRLSKLARRDLDERSNPFGPAVVCNVFAEALKGMQAERIAVDLVYKALRRAVEPQLERLYDEANKILADHGVLPQIERDKPIIKRPPKSELSKSLQPTPLETTLGHFHDPHAAGPVRNPAQPAAGGGAGIAPSGCGVPGEVYGAPAAPGVSGVPGTAPPAGFYPGPAGGALPPVLPGESIPGAGGGPAGNVSSNFAVAPASPSVSSAGAFGGSAVDAPAGGGAGAFGLDATFGGYGFGSAMAMVPSFQQAYSTAQAQLALRRQLMPPPAGGPNLAPGGAAGGQYTPHQIVDGLTRLQQSMNEATEPKLFDVEQIKQRITAVLSTSGGGSKAIGQAEGDAIEVIVNLFESLLRDALLTDFAKGQLKRLQPSVHKAALIDQSFFESTGNPVRQLLNRISMLREQPGADGHERAARVQQLIDEVNRNFQQDVSVFEPALHELDAILKDQRNTYEQNVEHVTKACDDQQRVLRERREKVGAVEGTGPSELPAEWNRWLNRSKALTVGERMIMNASSKQPFPVTLVWIGDDFNPYVFVDDKGQKNSTLTLQQVAMYLRRGVLKPVIETGEGAVDRALFAVVNRIHEQVEEQAAHDTLTGLLNRKTFMQTVEQRLPATGTSTSSAVLCQLSIDNLKAINEKYGVEAGDKVINSAAQVLSKRLTSKHVLLGRLSGNELGIYWDRGGLQSAYKEAQSFLDMLGKLVIDCDSDAVSPRVVAGLTEIQDDLALPDQLLQVVSEACVAARSTPDRPLYVAGTENKYRKHLEQMVSYLDKAIKRDRLALLSQEVRALSGDGLPATHIVVSAEDRNGKLVPTTLFAQAASGSEHAHAVGVWTIKKTIAWMAEQGENLDDYAAVIIPLSRAALEDDGLANLIINELMQTPVPPAKIYFSIENKDAVARLAETADLINTLREFGCRFILDEFGSGHGNYEYVKELAVDFVTIQTAYVLEARQNPKDFAMTKSINELVHFMGKRTIAKQSPDTDLSEVLREIGVDYLHDIAKTTRINA